MSSISNVFVGAEKQLVPLSWTTETKCQYCKEIFDLKGTVLDPCQLFFN